MAKYLFLILVLLFSNQAFSESNVSKLEKPILSTINKGEISNLASLAFPKGKKNARRYISDSDIEGLDITFRNTLSLLGDYYGYKLFHEAVIQDLYIIRYYILKYERQPILLKLEFYRPNDSWVINGMEFDTGLDNYMEDSAKSYIGNLSNE